MSRIRGVILDVDGTLIDSNDAHARAWMAALGEYGIDVSYDQVRPLIGMGGDKLLPAVGGPSAESVEGKAIGKQRAAIFKQRYLPQLQAFPMARELLQHLHERGIKLVVASSAKEEELEPLLALAGANDLIEDRISSSDAKQSKPDPDIVQVALDSLGLPLDQVLMIGDTPYDIEAARKAGIGTIALRCGGWHDDDLGGAIAIYRDPADLLAQYALSPLA